MNDLRKWSSCSNFPSESIAIDIDFVALLEVFQIFKDSPDASQSAFPAVQSFIPMFQ
jgi:hypothetical protein